MAIDISKNATHKMGFLNKLLATYGGAHTHNVTLAVDHDNFDLIGLTEKWNSFDNFDEDQGATLDFEGVVMGLSAENTWYIKVNKAVDTYLVYNSPVSEYPEKELQDEALFYNQAGETAEAIELRKGDIFSVNANGFASDPAVGSIVAYSNGKYTVTGSF